MKKSLIIIATILIIGIGITLWFFTRGSNGAPVQQKPVEFPSGGIASSSSPYLSNADSLLQNPNVKADTNNQGNYFIGKQPSTNSEVGSQPFIITYTAETKYFNITLTQEPIGEVRKKAESYLMQILSFSENQMCELNYSVYTPTTINSQFAGTNLGFSFCPGAVKLP